jgi:hypothetical protein
MLDWGRLWDKLQGIVQWKEDVDKRFDKNERKTEQLEAKVDLLDKGIKHQDRMIDHQGKVIDQQGKGLADAQQRIRQLESEKQSKAISAGIWKSRAEKAEKAEKPKRSPKH